MTIKELKEKIKDLPDDTVLLNEGGDHTFYEIDFDTRSMRSQLSKKRIVGWEEDYSDYNGQSYPEDEYGPSVVCLVVNP